MAGEDRSERIRALIEEVDRVRHESQQVTSHLERSMKKSPFWPDRRRWPRVPGSEKPDGTGRDGR